MDKAKGKSSVSSKIPLVEVVAKKYAKQLEMHIKRQGGFYLQDDNGLLHVVINGYRTCLSYGRDNHGLAKLMLDSCDVTTLSNPAQAAIQRLHVEVATHANLIRYRKFSALSNDQTKLYIPLYDGKLLRVSANEIAIDINGNNADSLWIEHPYDNPLRYSNDSRGGLTVFEHLLVDKQSCRMPEMRWFVAMHEGFFPYIRNAFPAQMILVHLGGTQQGKTSGAQRFTLLHGLGLVKGDFSVAALGNLGDIGLLIMDNREQANFTRDFIDYLLFLSTGAERGRSLVDGKLRTYNSRPVGVITSIEGVIKVELRARCVDVEYALAGTPIGRLQIEEEIKQHRHEIASAMVPVLQRYFVIREERRVTPNPIPEFEEHFTALCDLLRAFGEIAGKPAHWSDELINAWDRIIAGRENEEDDLEQPILRVLTDDSFCFGSSAMIKSEKITRQGKAGTLYVTTCNSLLTLLQKQNLKDRSLPQNATGLSRRLRSCRFRSFVMLDEKSAPDLPNLRRTAKTKPIGFFIEDDGVTACDATDKP